MEGFICKNSKNDKPLTVKQFDGYLEWQVKDLMGIIDYDDIQHVRVNRRGERYSMTIRAAGIPALHLSNRFYLPDGSWEDRSHEYATFVSVLHFRLKSREHIRFFSGWSWKHIFFIAAGWILATATAHGLLARQGHLFNTLLLPAVDFLSFAALIVLFLRMRPIPYRVYELPLHYLPV